MEKQFIEKKENVVYPRRIGKIRSGNVLLTEIYTRCWTLLSCCKSCLLGLHT